MECLKFLTKIILVFNSWDRLGHNHPAQKMQSYNMLITHEYVTLKITTSVYKVKSLFKNKGLFLKSISTATSNVSENKCMKFRHQSVLIGE